MLLLGLLVSRALSAPLAKLLELDFALNFLFVLFAPVIGTFAGSAGKLDESVLGHGIASSLPGGRQAISV